MERKTESLNEELKAREAAAREMAAHEAAVQTLDDTQRVKVLSPGRLVAKRFFRNKLAMVGLAILVVMFIFAFLCPLFYPYGQTETFFKYDTLEISYAMATKRDSYTNYPVDPAVDVHYSVKSAMTSYAARMEKENIAELPVSGSDGSSFLIRRLGDAVYTVSAYKTTPVATWSADRQIGTFNRISGAVETTEELPEGFAAAAAAAVANGTMSFRLEGVQYTLSQGKIKVIFNITCNGGDSLVYTGRSVPGLDEAFFAARDAGEATFTCNDVLYGLTSVGGVYTVGVIGDSVVALVSSLYVFDATQAGTGFSDEFKANALLTLYSGGKFTADGAEYRTKNEGGNYYIYTADGTQVAMMSRVAVRRYNGADTLSLDFKSAAAATIAQMEADGKTGGSFTFALPALDEEGNYVRGEDGQLHYADTVLHVTRKLNQYVLTCEQVTHLIDIYAAPSSAHVFGTDADGMDILARMMYGGRVSLMVGFVVVILETLLGTIMGGLAGFFGGWVDTLIMRLVDIFYCIPTYPILIIMGAYFDSIKLGSYMRLVWMMAIMGILGWAGVARLVRGQILSLREQEFMVAAEATGISTSRRIFKHLVPNVMPQLIVSATMGLGNVIIMESTLSFLGLGVKHPLATWGTMINSITSSNENLVRYAYIWIPVGLLICLTVIAFNFVGDGLRDAFDPKMKQ